MTITFKQKPNNNNNKNETLNMLKAQSFKKGLNSKP
jgi:hypothetical protein